jgi:hypothetical protein
MTKAELDSKHLSELHSLAAEAGVPRYRMLRREELIEKLVGGDGGKAESGDRPPRERPPRSRRERPARDRGARQRPARDRAPKEEKPESAERGPAPESEPPSAPAAASAESESARPRRKRRRRRFGRKEKGLRVQDLLLPPPGRQALVYGESRASCTALLREVAGELSGASNGGPDPIALLIDPSPEELADWKREAPKAEIVAAGQARHASDALAQAARRAEGGEDVILLVDSLSRLEESFDDAEAAKKLFDAGLGLAGKGSGSLTVVAALERQQQ